MATTKRKRTTPTPQQHREKQLRDLLGATLLVTDAKVNVDEACILFADVAYQLDDALCTGVALAGARLALDLKRYEQFVLAVFDQTREHGDENESEREQPCA